MTTKQIKAAKIIAVNGGITGKQLKKLGYSDTIVKNPQRVVKSKSIQFQLQKALKKHKITIDRAIKPISDGLNATRTVVIGKGEEAMADQVEDHAVRLKASAMSLKLLGIDKSSDIGQNIGNSSPELVNALKNGDEIELQRVVFNKKELDSESTKV